jgi:hypothetical protein
VGGGYGGGYAPGRSDIRQLKDNHDQAGKRYGTSRHGWLGKPGTRDHVQVITSDDPIATAKDVFSILSRGGDTTPLASGKGELTTFAPDVPGDGVSAVTFRPVPSRGDPAVDIKITGRDGTSYKIHFERGD